MRGLSSSNHSGKLHLGDPLKSLRTIFTPVLACDNFSTCFEPKYLSSQIFWKFWLKSVLVLATCSKITQRCKNTFRKHFVTHKKEALEMKVRICQSHACGTHFERLDDFMTVCERSPQGVRDVIIRRCGFDRKVGVDICRQSAAHRQKSSTILWVVLPTSAK